MTIVLLVTAGLLVRSLLAASKADVGFPTDGLAIVSADTNMLRYTPERSQRVLERSQRDGSKRFPGVQRVALASRLPVLAQFRSFQHRSPWTPEVRRRDGHVNQQCDGLPGVPRNTRDRRAPRPRIRRVGRPRRPPRRDRERTVRAGAHWPGDSAIGRVVYERTLSSGRGFEIVGVVADHTLQTVGETPQPAIYFSTTQRPERLQRGRGTNGDERRTHSSAGCAKHYSAWSRICC